MDVMDDLVARWRLVTGSEPAAKEVGDDLLRRWTEPHRHYHDLWHLTAVLDAVDTLAGHATDPDLVQLAAWFHDAVYDGLPGADEEASAALAAKALSDLDFDSTQVAEVVRLVRVTARHDAAPGDHNGAVLCDADLSVLGSDPDTYRQYGAGVRAEYQHVPDDEFSRERAAVLRRLLATEPLYRTATARQAWEASARRNLSAELAQLSVA